MTKKARGTFRKDRAAPRLAPPNPGEVGEPPPTFTKEEKVVWRELRPQVAPVYCASDRAAFCLLVKLSVSLEKNASMPPHVYAAMVRSVVTLLGQFGCTPATRTRAPQKPSPNPAADADEAFLFGNGPAPRPGAG